MAFNELPIPDQSNLSSISKEVLRVWIERGNLRVSIDDNLWDEPSYYGFLLGEVARHYVRAIGPGRQVDLKNAILRVLSDRLQVGAED